MTLLQTMGIILLDVTFSFMLRRHRHLIYNLYTRTYMCSGVNIMNGDLDILWL